MNRNDVQQIAGMSDERLAELMVCEIDSYNATLAQRDSEGLIVSQLNEQLNSALATIEQANKAIAGLRTSVTEKDATIQTFTTEKQTLSDSLAYEINSGAASRALVSEKESTIVTINSENTKLVETTIEMSTTIDDQLTTINQLNAR